MIEYLLDVYLCGLVVLAELIGAIAIGILTQYIFYKVFKINLYKSLCILSRKLDRKVNEYFG